MIFQMLANYYLTTVHKDQPVYWNLTVFNRKLVQYLVFLMKPDNRGLNALVSEQEA